MTMAVGGGAGDGNTSDWVWWGFVGMRSGPW